MKKSFLSLAAITVFVLGFGLFPATVSAQAPQSIFYQAVAHDASNNLFANHQVCVRFTVHDGTAGGTIIYQEKQVVTTDAIASFSANIGQGTVLGGTFSGINWGNNQKYLQVELDVSGQCTGYADMGTNEMISVPFALYAANADSATNAGTPQVNSDWNATSGVAQILNEPTIPVFPPTGGTTLQYINGIGQLIAFPTNVSAFTNDAGYLTNITANGLFIQNNTTPQSSANFNIDGSGTIANQLSVGGNTTVAGTKATTGLNTLNGGVNETGNTNIITANAGTVTISDPTPPAAAVVDVASTTQGFLPPRMTTLQRNAITVNLTTVPQLTTAQGLTIYNLDTHCIETFVGTHTPASVNWQPIGCGCSGPPAAPGVITGADTICTGSGNVTYAVPAVPATNYFYTWTLPAGATIVSGAGTDSITVSYAGNAVSGNVSVTAGSSCGTGSATTLAVVVTQTSVAPISLFARPTTICSGGTSSLAQSGGSLGTGATWNWYSDAGYTNFVGTGSGTDATLVVSPTQTTTYYLEATQGTGPCGGASVQGPPAGVTVTVTPGPVVTSPPSVCVGSSITLSPTTGGTWVSSDNTLATVTNGGLVTGVGPGSPTFTFTSGGCSSTTSPVTVNALPVVSAPASVCVSGTAQLTPATGGTWASSDNTLATVTNGGVVTGVATGSATFTFTQTGGCSNTTPVVSISAAPSVGSPSSVCAGSTVNVTPATGGTWVSSNNTLATVTNSGVVTGVSPGNPTFTFTTTGGCSTTTSAVTVNALPVVSAGSSVCIGGNITLSPTTGGTWSSSNTSFATVNNSGVVTGVAAGNPTFTFTLTATGCSNTTTAVSVTGSTATANAGAALSNICENSTSAALGGSVGGSATGGVWSDGGVGGTFNGGATDLNTTWTPPANYTGTATLTLTTTGGTCGNVTATKTETVGAGSTGTQTFNYTGGVQHFTVSSNTCATTITVDIKGAQGGYSQHNANNTATSTSLGGLGGRVQGTITVTPGSVLDVYVGGMGGDASGTYPNTMVAGTGGYNGGGNGGEIGIHFAGGGGGGASDIRPTGGALSTRMAVAGGGGGGGNWTANQNTDEGGPGGGTTGGAGYAASVQGGTGSSLGTPGGGGTQSAGGAAGYWMAGYGGCTQAKGALGTGGATCNSTDAGCGTAACQDDPGGGGGGGYYGGGAATQAGGGGGSSYPATGVTHTQGYQTGNGQVIISWP